MPLAPESPCEACPWYGRCCVGATGTPCDEPDEGDADDPDERGEDYYADEED